MGVGVCVCVSGQPHAPALLLLLHPWPRDIVESLDTGCARYRHPTSCAQLCNAPPAMHMVPCVMQCNLHVCLSLLSMDSASFGEDEMLLLDPLVSCIFVSFHILHKRDSMT